MKHIISFIFLWAFGLSLASEPSQDPNTVIAEWAKEAQNIREQYATKINAIEMDIKTVQRQLFLPELGAQEKIDLLVAKEQLTLKRKNLNDELEADLGKVRYLKGMSVIKSLYEKVLALDHHFASVQTFSEINKVSNPNHYPEFTEVKDLIQSKKNNKLSLSLTNILGNNIYASVTQTFLNLFGANLSDKEKESELKNVECILDFTLRMHNDLNTIYFETQFLRTSNDAIKEDIEHLFKDYTKPIGYFTSLAECRANDDWDTVRAQLAQYLDEIAQAEGNRKYKKQVNLEFSVDRLMQFVTAYNAFIGQGEKFYEKFAVILNSYENEQQCQSELPVEYIKLKEDINIAIEKFKIAYKPVEVNGSKMKEILYGINEYE